MIKDVTPFKQGQQSVLYVDRSVKYLTDFLSETTGPSFTKFFSCRAVGEGLNICSNGHAPLTKMGIIPMENI